MLQFVNLKTNSEFGERITPNEHDRSKDPPQLEIMMLISA
jgi:hypothetical protein